MFTGLVEELGAVVARTDDDGVARLSVRAPTVAADARDGDSIAVNGVCLTVVSRQGDVVGFDVVGETLARSTLGGLSAGDPVNLERAATPLSRLGGHLVQGHVDGVGVVHALDDGTLRVQLPPTLARYVVEKGSIAVDGVSLTVAAVTDEQFSVALIPATLAATTLGRRTAGDHVNLEVDIVAKYVERLLTAGARDGH